MKLTIQGKYGLRPRLPLPHINLRCSIQSRLPYIIILHCARRRQLRTPPNQKAELGLGAGGGSSGGDLLGGMTPVGAAAECAICLSEFAAGERINLNLLLPSSYSVLSQSHATK
ncbi:hypothetical protein Salat_2394200 [Sesamum alatum]|uniref:Uncharacterized protein n=1 Tax=Sesamum alatum TaxID=300844 RepID=A0AAE1XX95_9LAMI|nr:hypothetical protein Salat_2394200 [Sesamum alatum]